MTSLLSRYADCAFWLGRYVERAENLARILDVAAAFSRDAETGVERAADVWRQIVLLNADEDQFKSMAFMEDAETVIHFYTLASDNPGSIRSCMKAGRWNALQLRPLLSVEVWKQINGTFQDLNVHAKRRVVEHELSAFCDMVREACQMQAGIVDGTLYRDEAWYFLQIGRLLERADMTTRLVDLRAPYLSPAGPVKPKSLDISQWTAMLRSASGLHGYRRRMRGAITPASVAGYLIFDAHHPRSTRYSLETADRLLQDLRTVYHLPWDAPIAAPLHNLCAELRSQSIESVIDTGLHEFLDRVQRSIILTTAQLGESFFPPAE